MGVLTMPPVPTSSDVPAKLKALERQLARLQRGPDVPENEQHAIDNAIVMVSSELQRLRELEPLVITEHAMLRYLERVKGINLDEIRDEILNPEVLDLATKLHFINADIPSKTGHFRVRIKDRTVVTVLT